MKSLLIKSNLISRAMLAVFTVILACAHEGVPKQKSFRIIPNLLDEFICTLTLEYVDTLRPIHPIVLKTFHEAAGIIIAMDIYVTRLCASFARDNILSDLRIQSSISFER